MGAKEDILSKIRILITNHFETPEEAFHFFDEDNDKKLKKSEIKKLLKQAEISGFLTGIVASELLKGYDKDKDDAISWEEFQVAISELGVNS